MRLPLWWLFPGATGLLLMVSTARFVLIEKPLSDSFGVIEATEFEPLERPPPRPSERAWTVPEEQSAGAEWFFDVFTPPIVYFNAETNAFTVTPPVRRGTAPAIGLELLEVTRRLYRLQYAGHVGEEGSYRIEIHDVENDTYLRGRRGDHFPDADFAIDDFSVERRRVPSGSPGLTPYVETAVHLVIHDWRLNAAVELNQAPRYADDPVVTVVAADNTSYQLLPGETLMHGSTMFTLLEASAGAGTAHLRESRLNEEQNREFTLSLTEPGP